jgi:SAM-dependent methyltransferase
MPFYKDHIYPHLVDWLGNPPPIEKLRRDLIPSAEGTVLEIGVGSGPNFPYYDPARVNKLYALEPNQGMARRAKNRRDQTRIAIEFLDLPGERIPLGDATIDTVVSTFTLCTIPGVIDAIQNVGRVLKPDGKFVFLEHGVAPEPSVRRWQEITEPFCRWAFEGCRVTRDIPSLIREGGFRIEQMNTGYLAPFPKCGSYCYWGVARTKLM